MQKYPSLLPDKANLAKGWHHGAYLNKWCPQSPSLPVRTGKSHWLADFTCTCHYSDWSMAFCCMQVYFVDIDVNEGKRVQKELEDEFGHGMATFLQLDVTDKEKFEGRTKKTYTCSFIAQPVCM